MNNPPFIDDAWSAPVSPASLTREQRRRLNVAVVWGVAVGAHAVFVFVCMTIYYAHPLDSGYFTIVPSVEILEVEEDFCDWTVEPVAMPLPHAEMGDAGTAILKDDSDSNESCGCCDRDIAEVPPLPPPVNPHAREDFFHWPVACPCHRWVDAPVECPGSIETGDPALNALRFALWCTRLRPATGDSDE